MRQYLQDGPYIDPPVASGTALVSTSAEALWIGATFTPIFANDPKAGKIYCLRAGGIWTTNTSGTLILNPQYEACSAARRWVLSQMVTVPVSMTAVPWTLEMDIVFRTIGAAGANSTCIGVGKLRRALPPRPPLGPPPVLIPFGGTSASVDARRSTLGSRSRRPSASPAR